PVRSTDGTGAAEVSVSVRAEWRAGWAPAECSNGTRDLAAAEPVARGIGDLHRRGLALLGSGPDHGVGQHALDLGLVVDRVLLVAGAEEEDLPLAAAEGGTGAEHLSPGEGGNEDQLVRGRDVEHLAVHLLRGDDDRMGHPAGDRV